LSHQPLFYKEKRTYMEVDQQSSVSIITSLKVVLINV